MNRREALETVTVELEFPHETDSLLPRRSGALRALPKGLRNVNLLAQIFHKLRRGGKLVVEFDVPSAIKMGLESGEYVRKGGVIVTAEGHKVVCWLKEARAVRIGQAINVLSVLVEIWSEYVLNEKLKQIQHQLDRNEELVKAEYYSTLLDAHSSLKAAIATQDPEYQTSLFRESRSLFQTARNKTLVVVCEKVRKVDHQLRRLDKAWLDNRKEIEAIYSQLMEIAEHAATAVHCYRAESRILERMQELPLAGRIAAEALDFQLDVHQYLSFFTDGAPAYSDLELVRDAQMNRDGLDQGAIHNRVKTFHATDVLFPSSIVLRKILEALPSMEGETGFWVDEQGVVHVTKPIVLRLPDWLYEKQRPLRESMSSLEKGLPVAVFELEEPGEGESATQGNQCLG